MKSSNRLRMITEKEFHELESGDIVYIKISGCTFRSEVLSKPFWNSDTDEPDWEVETSNGFSDMYSLYVQ